MSDKKRGAPLGNTNATKSKPWADAIRKFMTQNPNQRDKIIEKLFEDAANGCHSARKEIFDRIDGKVAESMRVSYDPKELEGLPTDVLMERYEELLEKREKGLH